MAERQWRDTVLDSRPAPIPITARTATAPGAGEWWFGKNSMLGKFGRDLSGETARQAQQDAEQAAKEAADAERAWKDAQAARALAELGTTAEEYQAREVGPTAFDQISEDPELRKRQIEALTRYSDWAKGGLTDTDIAALDVANRRVAQQEAASRGAAEASMRARGVAPGGAGQLAAAQMARAAAAQRMSDQGVNVMQNMQQRQIGATGQMGSMAGNVRAQDYGVSSDRARARDAVAAFNAAAANAAGQFNANQRSNLRSARAGGGMVSYTPTNVRYTPLQASDIRSQQAAWDTLGGVFKLGAKGVGMAAGGTAGASAAGSLFS